jgi:energy-coupling factor transport system permease protein
MPVVVDLYTPRRSWVHRADPRVKLLFVGCTLLLLLVFRNLFIMLSALVLLHLLHWSARMPKEKLWFIWKTLLPVAMLMTVLWAVFYPTGQPFLQFWIVKLTVPSLAQGLVLGLRIMAMAFAVFGWLYTTDQPSLVRSLVKLRVPFEWGLILALALRYIPTFQGMYGIISDAQQARGLDFSQTKGYRRVRSMMPIFVAMIISSLRASDQLAKALEARAFGAKGIARTSFRDIRYRPADYALTLALIVLAAAALYGSIRFGFGREALSLFS